MFTGKEGCGPIDGAGQDQMDNLTMNLLKAQMKQNHKNKIKDVDGEEELSAE